MAQHGVPGKPGGWLRQRSGRSNRAGNSAVIRWRRRPGPVWRRTGSESRTSRYLGGERSPWKERAHVRRQRLAGATDPTVEQSLEVEGRCGMVNLFIGTCRRNDEGATAAAMRNGCSWGDFFGGCEGRDRERSMSSDASQFFSEGRAASGGLDAETARTPSGTGMQQARNFERGASRRGGAKPRGRNMSTRVYLEGRRQRQRCREWTRAEDVG